MADGTPIEWTDATWQIVTGCSVVSPGCTNCYAMRLAGTRLKHHPTRKGLTIDTKAGPVWTGEVRFNAELLTWPMRLKRPRMIFVAAHGDIFHEGVTAAQLDQIFAVAAITPQHTYQVLTKRAQRMRDYFAADDLVRRICSEAFRLDCEAGAWLSADHEIADDPILPLGNVWLGVSVEDQVRADERIPMLLETPAAVRWISAEPLLGPVNLGTIQAPRYVPEDHDLDWKFDALSTGSCYEFQDSMGIWESGDGPDRDARIDWVVAGGESGPGSRPMHPDWARRLRDQCTAAGVPFLFKQWGSFAPAAMERNVIAASANIAWPDGTVGGGRAEDHGGEGTGLLPMTKKAAGRLLDGVQHDGFPATSETRD